MKGPVRDSRPRQVRIDNQAGSSASTPVIPRLARRPLQGARAAGPLGARTPGHHGYVSGSSFGQGTNRKCPCCGGRRSLRGAAGAERSGTGKDDSGDSGFQQPWEAATGPLLPAFCECGPARHAPASIPLPSARSSARQHLGLRHRA